MLLCISGVVLLSGCSMIDLAAAGVFDAPTLILSKTKSTLSVLYVLFVEDRRRLLLGLLLGAVIVCDVRRAVDMIYRRCCYSLHLHIACVLWIASAIMTFLRACSYNNNTHKNHCRRPPMKVIFITILPSQ